MLNLTDGGTIGNNHFNRLELPVFDGLSGEATGSALLDQAVFGFLPREDIIHRVVQWQISHKHMNKMATRGRSEIARTGKKMYKQKGSGKARHSTAKAPQFRGGGRAFGGSARASEIDLPRKIRALGLKHVLSSKVMDGELMVVQNLHLPHIQTKSAKETLRRLGLLDQRCLIVYGEEVDLNFALSTRNIPEVDLMAAGGLNVYDVLKHPRLVLSRDALDHLDERFAAQTLWQVSDEDVWGDTVRSVPHKGSKPNLERVGVRGGFDLGSKNAQLQILLGLKSGKRAQRKDAMKKLVANPSEFSKSDLKARLLPLLFSDDYEEAKKAAVAIARVMHPENYRPTVGDDALDASRVRKDVEQVLKAEGILCFTYAEAIERVGEKVKLRVGLSSELPFKLDGRPARVENPEWVEQPPDFDVVISGAAKGTMKLETVEGPQDAEAELQFKVRGRKGARRLLLDFFANNRWFSRREILV
jgi:large subunit ribosomal protein L4